MQPIASLARTLSISAIAAFLLAAGVAAFAIGYLDHMRGLSAGPTGTPAQTSAALSKIESALGYGGFMRAQRRLRETPDAARDMAMHFADAQRALASLRAVPPDSMGEIKGILSSYEAALQSAQAGYPSAALDGPYQSLRNEAARIRQGATVARMDAADQMTQWAQWAILASLGLLGLGLLIASSILSRRVTGPLNQLRASLLSTGRDPESGPVWGVDRSDEIGAAARAAERLRKTLVETPVLPPLREGQALKIKLDGPSAALFEKLVQDIAQAGAQLETAGGAGREQLHAAAQRLVATAAEISGFATGARAEVNDALSALRGAAQEAQSNQTALTQITKTAGGEMHGVLSAMERRMEEALTSVSHLSDRLSASSAALTTTAEDSARRLASAAKDMEGRSKEAELRLGLALDQAGQQARAQAAESAALKTALAQALDDIRQARSGLEAAHGAPGTDLGPILNAVQELQSLLVQKAGAPSDTAPDSVERTGMPPMTPFRATSAARLPIAAADMLARLGSIAAEVRAAAGHDLTGLRAIADDLASALSVGEPSTDWASYAAAIEAEAGQLSADLGPVRESAAKTVEGLRAGAAGRPSGRAMLGQLISLLLADIAEADKFEPPHLIVPPASGADALEAAAQDLQRLGDIIADLEARTEALAQSSALSVPEGPDGVISANAARADQKTNEAIVAVMESIERLNNIAQALSRAGDFQAQRKAGE